MGDTFLKEAQSRENGEIREARGGDGFYARPNASRRRLATEICTDYQSLASCGADLSLSRHGDMGASEVQA